MRKQTKWSIVVAAITLLIVAVILITFVKTVVLGDFVIVDFGY